LDLTLPIFHAPIRWLARSWALPPGLEVATVTRAGRIGLFGLALAGFGISAWAGETISYIYDSRGRLVKVVRTGSVNNNVSANYGYDKADNRTNVNVVSPNPPP
jgi:hypothetical protein